MSIRLVGRDGKPYTLDSENPADLEEALRQGYKQQLADTSSTADKAFDALGAGATGALSGVTGGLSDAAIAAQSPEMGHEIARVAAAHPLVRGATEFAGMLASPINEVVRPIEGAIGATSTLGKVAAKGVSNAGAGSLFGAGNALSDSALGDHDLTAEKLIASGGLGALLGGAGGLFGGALEEGVAALPKLQKSAAGADNLLSQFAEGSALRAAGTTQADLNYLGVEKSKALGRFMLERGHLGTGTEAPNATGILENIQKDMGNVTRDYGTAIDTVDKAGARPDYKGVANAIDEWHASKSPLEQRAIANDVETAKAAALKHGDVVSMERTGQPPLLIQGEHAEGFRGLQKLKSDLQAQAKYGNNLADSFKGGLRKELAGVVREQFDSQIVPHLNTVTPEAGAKFLADKATLSKLYDAERVAEHGVRKLGGNAPVGLRDTIIGAGLLGGGHPVAGLVSSIASKVMRERGTGVVARLADAISKNPSLSPIAASFGQQLSTHAAQLGRYAEPLTQALAQGPAQALATHMTLARVDPHYPEAATMAGLTPETSEQQSFALRKAHGIATIAAQLEHHNEAVAHAVEQVFRGTRAAAASAALRSQDFGSKRMRRESVDAHRQHLDQVRQLAANPSALVDRVAANTQSLGDVAPGVLSSLTGTAHRAVAYLAQEAHEPPKAGPLAPAWVAPAEDVHRFSQALETVQDPMSVLRHAAAGTLTEGQMQALGAVYPLLARQIATKALERLAEAPKGIPYRARLMLGLLTGTDPDGTMGQVATNQDAIQRASQKPSNVGTPGGSTSSGKPPVTLAQRTALPTQKREFEAE